MSAVWFYEPFYDLDRFFDDAFFRWTNSNPNNRTQSPRNNDNLAGAIQAFRPRMDLYENKDTNTVTASFEFPGIRKEDVQIEVHNGRLTVSAEREISTNHEENDYVVRERRHGKFSRTLQLPEGIEAEQVMASMDNGILTLTFPKSTPEKAPKKVTVA